MILSANLGRGSEDWGIISTAIVSLKNVLSMCSMICDCRLIFNPALVHHPTEGFNSLYSPSPGKDITFALSQQCKICLLSQTGLLFRSYLCPICCSLLPSLKTCPEANFPSSSPILKESEIIYVFKGEPDSLSPLPYFRSVAIHCHLARHVAKQTLPPH